MEEIKTEPVDFVKEFQEYLTQQTQHVNMISGSVCGEKETTEPFQAVAPRCEQNGLDPPSVEVSLAVEDGSEVQMDGLERTCDGKYKCSYCSYANKGMARLIEHIRIHTALAAPSSTSFVQYIQHPTCEHVQTISALPL